MTFTVLPGNRPTLPMSPLAGLRYGLDVADVLAPGDTVASMNATTTAGTLTGKTFAGTVLQARLSGVTVGQLVGLTFTWVTTEGDSDARTLWLRVEAR